MSARFIIGRAGSGKTAWAFSQTVAACKADAMGSPILWLVPRQATFQTERDLCCGSGLGGFIRVQVVSFELLCRQVRCEAGGAAAAEVSRQGRQMILGYLLRRNQSRLRFFQSSNPHGGLAAELDATLDELERGGGDLLNLATQLTNEPANSALAEKLADLQLIYGDYLAFLGTKRLDPDRRMQQAMEAFERSNLLREAVIHVDGFLHFTHRERRLLAAMARVCRSIQISLTFDPHSPVLKDVNQLPDDLSLFHAMEMEYRKLHFAFTQAGVEIGKSLLLNEPRRFASAGLRRVEQWIHTAEASTDGLELLQAPDKRSEVEATARRVRDLVAGGLRYRDITVLSRELSEYHDLIDAAFAEHGIPYFADQRRSAAHHPLIQFLGAALTLAEEPWQAMAMTTLMKSGLCGLSATEADELENYVLLHGIRGRTWAQEQPWTGRRTIGEDEEGRLASAASAEQLRRRIVQRLSPFIAACGEPDCKVAEYCRDIFELFERFAIRPAIDAWMAAARTDERFEEAEEHGQVWAELQSIFEQLGELLGEQPMSLPDFRALLEGSLSQLDLAIAPATVDQVLVGQVDRTRSPAVKAAFILGLSDGQFPRPSAPRTIFSDADRLALASVADLESDSTREALDEEFLGYFAFTRASERLIVTRPAADESGRKIAPGSLWRKLAAIAGPQGVKTLDPSDSTDVSTPRQLVGGLMQWARSVSQETESSSWAALYQWMANRPPRGKTLDWLMGRAWPALNYQNKAELSPKLAHQLFSLPLHASVRQLEIFAACPFQHFARYGLHLEPRSVEGVSNQDISRLYHAVLDRLLRRLLKSQQDWCELPPEEIGEMLADLAVDAAREFKGDQMLSGARNQHLLRRIEATLLQVIAAQRAAGKRGEFRPKSSRTRYGQGGDLPPLRIATPKRDELHLHGEIDRVDVSKAGHAVIHDYRLRAGALSLQEVYHGLSLKLITDLLAWEQSGGRPVAGFATQLVRSVREDNPAQAPDPSEEKFDLRVKSRGIISTRHAGDLDNGLAPKTMSEALAIYLNKEAEFGRKDSTDVAEPDEFASLLAYVRRKLGSLADEIGKGTIAVRPYKLGNQTPCPACGYRDVCRFETSQGYVHLIAMKREEVLAKLKEGG